MRPLAILTGFVLGTAGSITFSMAVVGFLFLLLTPRHPHLQAEVGPLLIASGLFLCLTVASGLSFVGVLWERPWRWWAQGSMWVLLAAIVLHFLP